MLKFKQLMTTHFVSLGPLRQTELVLRYMAFAKEDAVLDIGCGAGLTELALTERVKEIIGIDISEPLVRWLNEHRRSHNVMFYTVDATKEPPPLFLDRFDKITCVDVLEHVEDPLALLAFIYGALRTGGIAAITFPLYNLHHGPNYFTRENAYAIFSESSFKNIEIRFLRLNKLAFW